MIEEFDDGDMGIETDSLFQDQGLRPAGRDPLTKMDAPGFECLILTTAESGPSSASIPGR